MAGYGKHGTNYGKLGGNGSESEKAKTETRTPAYSSAYSGASYIHFIQ